MESESPALRVLQAIDAIETEPERDPSTPVSRGDLDRDLASHGFDLTTELDMLVHLGAIQPIANGSIRLTPFGRLLVDVGSAPISVRQRELEALEAYASELSGVQELKRYALKVGIEIPESLSQQINALPLVPGSRDGHPVRRDRDDLDVAIGELTRRTYPITIDNVGKELERIRKVGLGSPTFADYALQFGPGIIGIALVAVLLYIRQSNSSAPDALSPLIAGGMGVIGASIYGMFNVLHAFGPGVRREEERRQTVARFIVGMLLGFGFYFLFNQGAVPITSSKSTSVNASYVVALVAGYNTELAVAIMNRVILGVRTMLGMTDDRPSVSPPSPAARTRQPDQ